MSELPGMWEEADFIDTSEDECTCRKHIGIGAGGQHIGGWTDPDCVVHKGERPPWMKLDDGMPPGGWGPRLKS